MNLLMFFYIKDDTYINVNEIMISLTNLLQSDPNCLVIRKTTMRDDRSQTFALLLSFINCANIHISLLVVLKIFSWPFWASKKNSWLSPNDQSYQYNFYSYENIFKMN